MGEKWTVSAGPAREIHPAGVYEAVIVDQWQWDGTNKTTGADISKQVFTFETSEKMDDGRPYHHSEFVRIPEKSFNTASNLYKFAEAYDGLTSVEGNVEFDPETMIGKKFHIQIDHSNCGNYANLGKKPVALSNKPTIEANPEFVRRKDRDA